MLSAPSSRVIRPTSERLRELIFDILEHRYPGHIEDARVVDLFAGAARWLSRRCRAAHVSRSLSIMASRRARCCAPMSRRMGLGGVTRIWRADATRLGSAPAGDPFGLAFLDPPYGQGLAGPALASLVAGGWLAPKALCVVEEAAKAGDRRARRAHAHRRPNLRRHEDRVLRAGSRAGACLEPMREPRHRHCQTLALARTSPSGLWFRGDP